MNEEVEAKGRVRENHRQPFVRVCLFFFPTGESVDRQSEGEFGPPTRTPATHMRTGCLPACLWVRPSVRPSVCVPLSRLACPSVRPSFRLRLVVGCLPPFSGLPCPTSSFLRRCLLPGERRSKHPFLSSTQGGSRRGFRPSPRIFEASFNHAVFAGPDHLVNGTHKFSFSVRMKSLSAGWRFVRKTEGGQLSRA